MFAFSEFFDAIIVVLALGYIFKDFIRSAPKENFDPLEALKSKVSDNFLIAIYITAPAILLHELAHKLAALYFNMSAVFHASYEWLGIGVVLKLLNTGFIFLAPGYVQISGAVTPLQHALVAGAGPFTNLLIFIAASLALKYGKFSPRTTQILGYTKKINIFLFVFNLLPIGGFDGRAFFTGLYNTFF